MQKHAPRRRYPRARPDLTFRPAGGAWALHDRTGLAARDLDLLAALVLTCCDGRHDAGAICAQVGALAPADEPAQVRARVLAILERFARDGLLH